MRSNCAAAMLAIVLLGGCATSPRLSSSHHAPLAAGGPVAVVATDEADLLERDVAQALRRRLTADGVRIVDPDQASRLLQVSLVRVSRDFEVAAPAASTTAQELDFGAPPKGVHRWLSPRDSYRLVIASIDLATGRLVESRWASIPAARDPSRAADRLLAAALDPDVGSRR